MMEAVRTSETSVDNHFTRQYNPEENSEHHIRRRENLKSHRWEDVIQRDAAYLLRIGKWKAAARDKEWRKEIGDAMDRKRAEAL
jgi:hypothetical protein